jgi:heptaprenyl diphosphate synthase
MTLLWFAARLPGDGFSAIGYSVLASLAHMTGQFTLAWLLFIPNTAVWRLFPVLLTAALLFGIISGIIARTMCNEGIPCRT